MDAAELIDELIEDRVVVFGSLPPRGRDIDVVARPAELEALDRGLRAAGFGALGGSLVRFRNCGVEAVELEPISDWGLPSAAAAELFDSAIPLPGRTLLCRPAPAQAMLIAARRLLRERGSRPGKAARYFAAAREEDADALTAARERAGDWGVAPALEALRSGSQLARSSRVAGLVAARRRSGSGRLRTIAHIVRQGAPRRPRRGALIALSGLDGSGKSTQANALAEVLCRLGFDARVAWVPMGKGPWLDRLDSALRPLVRPLVALRARVSGASGAAPRPASTAPDATSHGPEREPFLHMSPTLTTLWSTAVALRLALRTGIVLRTEIWRGRVIVCDRYVLDAWTYLRFHYLAAPSLLIQGELVRRLSPRPLRAYALVVAPETATRRKAEYDVDENARRSALYEESMQRLGVEPIDGTLPREEICARIASEVCAALSGD